MTYYDNRSSGKRREIPKERTKPLTREWEDQLLQRRYSALMDKSSHDFYPPSSHPNNSRIFFKEKSENLDSKDPNFLFGTNASGVTFPNSKNHRNSKFDVENNEIKIMRGLPVNRNKSNQVLHHKKSFTPRNERVIRPRVTPRRKRIEFLNNQMTKSLDRKPERDVRPPDFYEKWKGYEPQKFERHKQEREAKFDRKDPFYRIYADNFKPLKKKSKNINDRIGEFERTLLHREAFDPSDTSVSRDHDKKCAYSRIWGIDERLLQKEPFNHHDKSPQPVGKHDRKCLKHRLYGYDDFPEEQKESGRISPRTRNLYGQLCKIRPDKENEGDYQKKDLKSRLYGTPYRPKVEQRDRKVNFDRKLHNPSDVKESSHFRNRFGDYEWKKLYRMSEKESPRKFYRHQPKRRLYLQGELPEHNGSFRKLGSKEVKRKKLNLNTQLYGVGEKQAKDFLEYQRKLKEDNRLNQRSLFEIPVRKPQTVTKKPLEYNPWKDKMYKSPHGFKNKSGKYFDVQ